MPKYEPSADDLFNIPPNFKEVRVPELDKDGNEAIFYLKKPSALTLMAYQRMRESKRKDKLTVKIILGCCVTEAGARLFTDADVNRIQDFDLLVWKRLTGAFSEMLLEEDNELSDNDEEE